MDQAEAVDAAVSTVSLNAPRLRGRVVPNLADDRGVNLMLAWDSRD